MKRCVLVLGGAGLVGTAIVRALQASHFALTPLVFDRREPPERVPGVEYVIGDQVNIFDPDFVLGLVREYDPMAIIDAVNIASLASRSGDLLKMVRDYSFQVIAAVVKLGILWLDIGTVATGGMGAEIPYTHNEACDGELAPGLIAKNAAASLHDGFLALLGRTPGQYVGRVVPQGMVGFEPPIYGPMFVAHLGGVPHQFISRVLPIDDLQGVTLTDAGEFADVGCRCGENGYFGLEEIAAITAIGQMETVTAEAVASAAMDVLGRLMANSGTYIRHDLQPDVTSFAASRRILKAMEELRENHDVPSNCFGNLGPFLTTHLHELQVLSEMGFTPETLADFNLDSFQPDSRPLLELAERLPGLGIPVLTDTEFIPCAIYRLDDKKRVIEIVSNLSGDDVVTQFEQVMSGKQATGEKMWFVDLRTSRVRFWAEQAQAIAACTAERSHLPLSADKPLQPGGFWAAYNIARGHGRQDYSFSVRY